MSDMEPLRDDTGEPVKLATATYRLEGRDKAVWLAGHHWGERDAESEDEYERNQAEEKLGAVRQYAIGLERLLGVRRADGTYDTVRSQEVLAKLAEFSADEAKRGVMFTKYVEAPGGERPDE